MQSWVRDLQYLQVRLRPLIMPLSGILLIVKSRATLPSQAPIGKVFLLVILFFYLKNPGISVRKSVAEFSPAKAQLDSSIMDVSSNSATGASVHSDSVSISNGNASYEESPSYLDEGSASYSSDSS